MKNKVLNKIFAVMCTAALVSGALVGCGSAEDNASKGESVEAGEEKEERVVSAMFIQSQYREGMQKMVEKLEAEENIIIDAQVVPDDQYVSLLQMKQASGELPDLIQNNVPHLYQIISPEEELYDFSDEPWVAKLTEPEVSQVDGKQYAFPLKASSGYHAVIYNADLFTELGIEIPTTPEEFDAVCDKLLENGVSPILMASELWVPQIWTASGFARAMGSEEAAAQMTQKVYDGEANFSDYPELVEVLDDMLSFKTDGYLNEDIATLTWDDAWSRLSAGEGAMIMGEAAMIGQQQATYPDTHFGVFNYPASYDPEGHLSVAKFASGLASNKNSENIDVVKEIFELFSTPEYADLYFTDGNSGFPAFEGVNGGEMQEDIVALYEEKSQEGMLVKEMNMQWSKVESLQNNYLWVYYSEALNKGEMDGKDVLDRFQEDVIKFIEENDK